VASECDVVLLADAKLNTTAAKNALQHAGKRTKRAVVNLMHQIYQLASLPKRSLMMAAHKFAATVVSLAATSVVAYATQSSIAQENDW
jgi:hypothetical protein